MTLIVIHQVRTKKGAPPEPVGLWAINGDDGEPFYPPEHEKHLVRAQKALMARPHIRLEEWVHYKTKTSSNWRIPGPLGEDLFESPVDTSLEAIYRRAHDEYLSHVDHLSEVAMMQHQEQRTAVGEQVSSPSWGSGRFPIAQSWWIASELVRRHPELIVSEEHPGGIYDLLSVTSPEQSSRGSGPSPMEYRVMLNRPGTVGHTSAARWHPAAFRPNSPAAAVRRSRVTVDGDPAPWAPTVSDRPEDRPRDYGRRREPGMAGGYVVHAPDVRADEPIPDPARQATPRPAAATPDSATRPARARPTRRDAPLRAGSRAPAPTGDHRSAASCTSCTLALRGRPIHSV